MSAQPEKERTGGRGGRVAKNRIKFESRRRKQARQNVSQS